jgi:SH3-like domain-containing protein
MELMKRIVAGLVDSVQSLSKAKDAQEIEGASSESFPFPVQVTAAKAHLRKGADLSTPSLLEVTKDTTLMAFAGTDKWLKVNTPRGEDAWISRSVVEEKKG